jgi:sugar phosphate isomerase/epimerase
VEGGYGGWIHSTRLLLPHMRGVAVKDFAWKTNAKGAWAPGWCALGKGMVPFRQFLTMLKAGGFSGPLQLHMEYPELGGADSGRKTFSIPKDQLLAIMRRDVETLKGLLRETGWA